MHAITPLVSLDALAMMQLPLPSALLFLISDSGDAKSCDDDDVANIIIIIIVVVVVVVVISIGPPS